MKGGPVLASWSGSTAREQTASCVVHTIPGPNSQLITYSALCLPVLKRSITFFHPDYPHDSPIGGTIIQTSTGACFRFPLDLLSVSEIFANAAELSKHDPTSDPVIPLDIICPEGFHVIMSVLQPVGEGYTLSNKTARLRGFSPETLGEGFEAAEILDIHDFAKLLLPYYVNPFFRFAIASGSNDAALLQAMTGDTLHLEFGSMSRSAQRLLEILNTSAFDKLRRLHSKRREAPPKSLLAAMMSNQPMSDGSNDFSRLCRKTGCRAMKSVKGRSWAQLRSRGASDVWTALVKMEPIPCQWREMADWILNGSCRGCGTCQARLSDSFGRALDEAERKLPREL